MAGYANFTFYAGTYLGIAIAEADFPRLALRASEIIDRLTYQRAAEIVAAATDTETINAIKLATCAVADEYLITEQRAADGGGVIASERQGQYAVSYVEANDAKLSTDARYLNAAKLYLGQTKLLYAGFYEDELPGNTL